MLLFSTLLSVNDSFTKDAFVDLILEWNNTGSRASNVVPGIEWRNSFGVKFGTVLHGFNLMSVLSERKHARKHHSGRAGHSGSAFHGGRYGGNRFRKTA